MRARRDAAIKLLKIMMVASVVLPAALFSYAAWTSYKTAFSRADEQLSVTLDIMSEQADKVFQSVDLSFAGVDALTSGLTDEEILAAAPVLHSKLKTLADSLAAVDGIWVFDKTAHPLVTSRLFPAPRDLDVTDREYFQAQAERDAGTFVGPLVNARVTNEAIISVSRRR